MTPRVLTPVEEAEVIVRYRAGLSTRQLAQRFGVGKGTIQRCLNRHGVRRRLRGGPRGAREAGGESSIGVSHHPVLDLP